MKFNWGTGIFIVLTVFILAIIAFFIFINSLDVNLVEDNYYEKELAYQEMIDKINNTVALPGNIKLTQEPGVTIISFSQLDSSMMPAGTIWFYRPSDPKIDFSVPLQLNDSSRQVINTSGLSAGKWIVKLDWEMGGKEYYFEEGLIIEH
jgi:hypothetical protein